MGISLVMMAAVLTVLIVVSRQQPRISAHGHRIQDARVALEQVTRDLRMTYAVNSSSSTYLDVLTYMRVGESLTAEQRHVVYDCSGGSCSRQEGVVDGTLSPAETIFTGVDNADIFSYEPDNVNPHYLRIKFSFDIKNDQTDPTGPATLSAGVQLRNVSNPG